MHQPSAGLAVPLRHRDPGEHVLQEQAEMAELIAEHTGQPVEKIIVDSDRDRWFTAEEAMTTASSTTSRPQQIS